MFDKNRDMAVVLPLDPTLGKPRKLLDQVRDGGVAASNPKPGAE
jgi:hypothetical protein